MVYWVLLWRQLDQVVFINVRRVALGVLLLRRIIEAVVHNLFSLVLVHASFGIQSGVLFTHGGVVLVDGLEVLASVLMPWTVAHERLIYASPGKLHINLWSARSLCSLGTLLLIGEQIFEIIVLLGQGAACRAMRKHAIILG